jgi:hypothetical protein
MPFNGLSGAAYYRSILNVDPFQETEKYPPSNTSVTLTEDVNFKITHPTNQEAARMGVPSFRVSKGPLCGSAEGPYFPDS